MPPLVDLPLHELRVCRPPLTRKPDFDAFWEETLTKATRIPRSSCLLQLLPSCNYIMGEDICQGLDDLPRPPYCTPCPELGLIRYGIMPRKLCTEEPSCHLWLTCP